MTLRQRMICLTITLVLCGFSLAGAAQRIGTGNRLASSSCVGGNPSGALTVRSPESGTPLLSLCEGRTIGSGLSSIGQAQPVALASGDFDEDGTPDLVSGFSSGNSGKITIHRGNVNALWPYGAALRNGPPPAFLSNPRSFSVPESPDFLAVGDFDADGHWDIAAAKRGGSNIYLLRGDGHGGFRAPQAIALGGSVTAMISGEINRADGLADIVVAVNTAAGARALVFESARGALQDQPEIFALPRVATALALGRFDGGTMFDLAIGAGNQLVMIHARDRKLSLDEAQRASVPTAKVTVQNVSFAIQALTGGDFIDGGASVAALGADGAVHILQHTVSSTAFGRVLTDPDFQPTFQLSKPDKNGNRINMAGRITPNVTSQLAAMRQSFQARTSSSEWTERSKVALPAGFGQSTPRLVAGRLTGSVREDILAADSANSKVHVLSTARVGTSQLSENASARQSASVVTPGPMRLLGSLESMSAPAAVLPMRLNQHGLNGLVMLHAGQSEPTLMPHDTPPANIFTVTNTSDAIITSPQPTQYTGPDGSLRKAMFDASQAEGTSSIVFNIPTTDPGYNPVTGAFLIQPLSESVPGAFNDFALPPINATVTIDGYTQPGASPNTLANGSNARLLIQIDGSKATTPGGAGLVPFDDVGSVYRGLIFTGWILGDISSGSSGNTESGAEGIEANGVADFIEGNFFGVDATGKTAAPNRIGVFADNGPGLGSTAAGNIIGGTTPQARNILSGNTLGGALFLSTAIEAELQGNWIGLDVTGTTVLPNGSDGTGLNGPTVTIGGTLPGDTNVITGNATNVDINDITEGNAAQDSSVQGNLIGTDPTGTIDVANGRGLGASIVAGPSNMLIGGTTPAARNIISGNNYGVYIYDGAFNNTVQGNYIGTDITGTKALGNATAGFSTGVDSDPLVMLGVLISAGDTTLGGSTPGAGNVISGNSGDGVQVTGASNGPTGQDALQGNVIQGNFIGTDATGKNAVPNRGNGVFISGGAANNIIGGTQPGSGNIISNNAMNGVLIDPGTAGGGTGNNTIANTIWSNLMAGIKINTGNSNRISQNSIFENGALGIALGTGGPNINTSCNSSNSGPNNLQNAPSLTAGTGSIYLSATATDPNGNTSEFSNAIPATLNGNVLSFMGSFNSTANTTYNIEFFSSTAADPSGFGQGETYLGSATVTTNGSCTVPVSTPINTNQADMGVTLSEAGEIITGPDYGANVITGTVTNHGAATAHDVVFTDTLPTGFAISSMYCNVGPCQTSVASSLGTCTVSGQVITCNMGTMASGASATVSIPVQASQTGSLVSTATVHATEVDPNLANNTFNLTSDVVNSFPFIDSVQPASVLVNSASFPLTVYGENFSSQTAISFNGTALPTKAVFDNQNCTDSGQAVICTGIQVQVPASLVTTAGTVTIEANNLDPGLGDEENFPSDFSFTIAPSCTYSIFEDLDLFGNLDADGSGLIANEIEVTPSAPSCTWTVSSSVPWAVVLGTFQGFGDTETNVSDSGTVTGSATVDVSVAPNTGSTARTGTITAAGQTFTFTQDPSADCSSSFSPIAASYTSTGGSGSIPITSNCFGYFVQSYAPWITIPQSSALLVDNATAAYAVAPNTGAPRTGTITIDSSVFTVTQSAPACYYTLSTTSASLPVAGGTGSIGVTPSSPSCAWTAKSSNIAVLSVTSGASGTGNGTVNYSVPVNKDGAQTATITIGDTNGGSSVFTETQASAFTCTFNLSPASIEVSSNGTSNFILVNSSFSFCKWTANSSDPTALSIKQNPSGTGTGAIYYAVAQNTSTSPRVLTIVAGCETFTVNQDGVAAANPVPAITSLSPSGTTAGSGAFTLTINGSNFITTSSVNFNGVPRATTYVNSTQLTAAILATDVASVGTPAVTVTNPSPGGGTSNALTFTITAPATPAPVINSLLPATAVANSGAFTLTVNGSNFISGATVNFNGAARTTTFKSATQLTAAILAADITSVATVPVTVTNPAPSSQTSTPVNFSITAAAAPIPGLSPTTISFATTTVNTTTTAPAVTLSNTGSAALTISSIGITGTGAADFSQTNTCGSSLAAGSTCAITVSFTPASAASFSATLTVTDNGTPSTQSVTLSGTGTAPTAPVVSLTPPALTFSAQTGTTATAQAATLKNTGNAALTISNFGITGTGAADFAETNTCGSSLAAGAICSISVTFTPASVATFTASLLVTDNASGSPHAVALTGTGTAAPAPAASLAPTALTFTAQTGITATAQVSTLKNTGDAALTITGITITGTGATDFAQTNTCGSSLAANASCSISVTFTPASAATFSAAVSIADNATGSPQSVTLSGTGTAPPAPIANVTPTSLTFTAQTGNTTNAQTATLKNTGNAVMNISGITLGGAGAADFTQTNTCGETLAAGANCTISVTFTPASVASFSAAISIADDAAGSPQTVTLSGTGTAPPVPTYTVSSSTAPQTIQAGGTAQYSVTVTAQNGTYSNPVTFSASGLPSGATATFTPSSVTPGSGSATSQLSIQTAASVTPAGFGSGWRLAVSALSLAGLFFAARRFRRRWVTLAILLFASLGAVATLSGCGGGFGLRTGTNYTITIQANSGETQQSTTVQLTVQ